MANVSTGESSQNVKFLIAPIPVAPAVPAYTEIANVTNINITGQERSTIDVTALRSMAKEYVAGFLESGSISFDIFINPGEASYQNIRTYFRDNKRFMLLIDTSEMQVQGNPDDWKYGFEMTAFVTNPGDITFEIDAAIRGTVNCKITGNMEIIEIA